MVANISATSATVSNRLGADDLGYICHSSIGDSRSISPILYFGITFYLALGE